MKKLVLILLLLFSSCTFQNYLSIKNNHALFTVLKKEIDPTTNMMFKYTLEYWEMGSDGRWYAQFIEFSTDKNWDKGDVLTLKK